MTYQKQKTRLLKISPNPHISFLPKMTDCRGAKGKFRYQQTYANKIPVIIKYSWNKPRNKPSQLKQTT